MNVTEILRKTLRTGAQSWRFFLGILHLFYIYSLGGREMVGTGTAEKYYIEKWTIIKRSELKFLRKKKLI